MFTLWTDSIGFSVTVFVGNRRLWLPHKCKRAIQPHHFAYCVIGSVLVYWSSEYSKVYDIQ